MAGNDNDNQHPPNSGRPAPDSSTQTDIQADDWLAEFDEIGAAFEGAVTPSQQQDAENLRLHAMVLSLIDDNDIDDPDAEDRIDEDFLEDVVPFVAPEPEIVLPEALNCNDDHALRLMQARLESYTNAAERIMHMCIDLIDIEDNPASRLSEGERLLRSAVNILGRSENALVSALKQRPNDSYYQHLIEEYGSVEHSVATLARIDAEGCETADDARQKLHKEVVSVLFDEFRAYMAATPLQSHQDFLNCMAGLELQISNILHDLHRAGAVRDHKHLSKIAKKFLNIAESYETWRTPRTKLDTLVISESDEGRLTHAIIEQPLVSVSRAQIIDEYLPIIFVQNDTLQDKKSADYLQLPNWFKELSMFEQILLRDLLREEAAYRPEYTGALDTETEAVLVDNLHSYFKDRPLPASIKQLVGVPNFSLHSLQSGNRQYQHARTASAVPFKLLTKTKTLPEAIRIGVENYRHMTGSLIRMRAASQALGDSTTVNVSMPILDTTVYAPEPYILPESRMELAKREAIKALEKSLRTPEAINNNRAIYEHYLSKLQAMISSASAICESEDYTSEEKAAAYKRINIALGHLNNYNQLTDEAFIGFPAYDTDGFLYFVQPEFIQTTHPINAYRGLNTGEGDRRAVLRHGEAYLNRHHLDDKKPERYGIVEAALKAYKANPPSILSQIPVVRHITGIVTAVAHPLRRTRNNQLYRTALEMIIVEGIGGVSKMNCRSGKDRTGVGIMYVDSLTIYYETYGTLPDLSKKTDQTQFANIFYDILSTEINQKMAGQNAIGTEGLKNLYSILPSFLISHVEARAISQPWLYPFTTPLSSAEILAALKNKDFTTYAHPETIIDSRDRLIAAYTAVLSDASANALHKQALEYLCVSLSDYNKIIPHNDILKLYSDALSTFESSQTEKHLPDLNNDEDVSAFANVLFNELVTHTGAHAADEALLRDLINDRYGLILESGILPEKVRLSLLDIVARAVAPEQQGAAVSNVPHEDTAFNDAAYATAQTYKNFQEAEPYEPQWQGNAPAHIIYARAMYGFIVMHGGNPPDFTRLEHTQSMLDNLCWALDGMSMDYCDVYEGTPEEQLAVIQRLYPALLEKGNLPNALQAAFCDRLGMGKDSHQQETFSEHEQMLSAALLEAKGKKLGKKSDEISSLMMFYHAAASLSRPKAKHSFNKPLKGAMVRPITLGAVFTIGLPVVIPAFFIFDTVNLLYKQVLNRQLRADRDQYDKPGLTSTPARRFMLGLGATLLAPPLIALSPIVSLSNGLFNMGQAIYQRTSAKAKPAKPNYTNSFMTQTPEDYTYQAFHPDEAQRQTMQARALSMAMFDDEYDDDVTAHHYQQPRTVAHYDTPEIDESDEGIYHVPQHDTGMNDSDDDDEDFDIYSTPQEPDETAGDSLSARGGPPLTPAHEAAIESRRAIDRTIALLGDTLDDLGVQERQHYTINQTDEQCTLSHKTTEEDDAPTVRMAVKVTPVATRDTTISTHVQYDTVQNPSAKPSTTDLIEQQAIDLVHLLITHRKQGGKNVLSLDHAPDDPTGRALAQHVRQLWYADIQGTLHKSHPSLAGQLRQTKIFSKKDNTRYEEWAAPSKRELKNLAKRSSYKPPRMN